MLSRFACCPSRSPQTHHYFRCSRWPTKVAATHVQAIVPGSASCAKLHSRPGSHSGSSPANDLNLEPATSDQACCAPGTFSTRSRQVGAPIRRRLNSRGRFLPHLRTARRAFCGTATGARRARAPSTIGAAGSSIRKGASTNPAGNRINRPISA